METVISRRDIFDYLACVGGLFLLLGVIGTFIPYHPIHLIFLGLLMFFGGYYYSGAERDKEKIIKKEQEQKL